MKVTNSQKRLLEMMEYFGIKQADIVKKTGIPKGTLSLYCSGQREPRQDKLSIIAEAYSIDPAWLMGHDVPIRQLTAEEAAGLDAEIAKKMIRLSDEKKKIVLDLIDSLLDL